MKKFILFAASALFTAAVVIPIGCETESAATNNVRITPSSATVRE